MAVGGQVFTQQVVEVGVELARGHHRGVLRLQRARGGVARIGEERLLAGLAFAVQGFERHPRHQNLAAYLERAGIVAVQHEGDGADGFHVVRHVVALLAVAAGHGTHQLAVFVGQGDGRAVELQLAADFKVLVQGLLHPLVEVGHLALGVGVTQRKHGIFVGHLREVLVQVAAHTHRGRVFVRIFGMRLLQVLQFAHQVVELLVRDFGSVQYVVVVVVAVQLGTQPVYSFFGCHSHLSDSLHAKIRVSSRFTAFRLR